MAASPLFAELWRSNTIDTMGEGTKVLIHREAGRLSLEYSSFAVEGQPDLTMIVYNPSTPEDAQKISALLSAAGRAPD
jgi:predicted phosphohydrolase